MKAAHERDQDRISHISDQVLSSQEKEKTKRGWIPEEEVSGTAKEKGRLEAAI